MNFVVLWMPTIAHECINHPTEEKIVEKNISDIQEEPFWIKICFNPETKNITICYKKDECYVDFVTLVYKDESRNGMVYYSYEDAVLKNSDFKFTGTTFPEVIYHLIKEFYHEHDFHENESDSSLRPYIQPFSEDFDFKAPNNRALAHYLKCYEKVLQSMVAQSKLWMNILRNKNLENNTKVFVAIPKLCIMARGYETYLGTLYNSRYNTWCHLNHTLEHEDGSDECNRKKEMRQLAFNIENAIKYFRALEYEFGLTYQQKNTEAVINRTAREASNNMQAIAVSSKSSTRWAVASIVISCLFSLGSIGYSARIAKQSSAELDATKRSLDISIEELADITRNVSLQQDSLHRDVLGNTEMDELQKSIRNLQKSIDKLQYHLQNN